MIPVIIPARMGSTRFPGKPLALIANKSLIQRVCELSAEAVGADLVYVATDHFEIENHVKSLGFKAIKTQEKCLTGSDRVAEAMRVLGVSKALNVQGDEPLLRPETLIDVAARLSFFGGIYNCYTAIRDAKELESSAVPKVVIRNDGTLMYASRAPIPSKKISGKEKTTFIGNNFRKQVCIYGFSLEQMENFGPDSKKSPIEESEDIEIIRFLENGYQVTMIESQFSSIAVDYPSDIARVERFLQSKGDRV